MTACADDSASDRAARENAAFIKTAGDRVPSANPSFVRSGIAIAALAGVPPTEANLFSEMLKEETERASVQITGMTGAMGAGETADGTYVVAVIDIRDGEEHVHRIVSETTLPGRGEEGDVWEAVDDSELRHFAAATADKIATWYSTAVALTGKTMPNAPATANDDITTGSVAARKPDTSLPFEVSIGPAPGDGNISLARALDGALKRRITTATWLQPHRYRIEGNVAAASRDDGKTDVSIRWLVKSAAGEILGEVLQRNALDAESVAGMWGEVAETAAEAAADGVLAVLEAPLTTAAANS